MKNLILILSILMSFSAISQTTLYGFKQSGIDEKYEERYVSPPPNNVVDIPLYKVFYTDKFSFYTDTVAMDSVNVLRLPWSSSEYIKGNGAKATFPTNLSSFTNGPGYITSITSGNVTTALGYTPLSAEVDGSTTNEIQTLSISTNTVTLSNGGGSITLPSISNPGTNNYTAYASGTVYSLTTTSAKVDFGTNDPIVTLGAAGTYMIFTNIRVDYAGLTNAVTQACSFKLRRTNNTAADITNATGSFGVPVVTLLTQTAGDCDVAPVIYTTTNNNDVIELWGNRGGAISVGSINVGSASIVAVRIY